MLKLNSRSLIAKDYGEQIEFSFYVNTEKIMRIYALKKNYKILEFCII